MQFYWEFTPLELQRALDDHAVTSSIGYKAICETLRTVAVVIHNSAFGRERKDMIKDPKKLMKFGWEKDQVKIQSVDEMKEFILGIAHHKNVTVTSGGKEIDV